jgi:hypothetical protein
MAAVSSSSLNEKQTSTSIISFIKSQKGKPLLISNKFIFKLNKSTINTKYWICTFSGCAVKIHTSINDEFIKMIGKHCHPAEEEIIGVREFRENVKQRAICETTPIPRIYDEECEKAMLSPSAIAILPSEREISKRIMFMYV